MAKTPYAVQMARWAERRWHIRMLRSDGWTMAQIAKRLKISKQRVHQVLSK